MGTILEKKIGMLSPRQRVELSTTIDMVSAICYRRLRRNLSIGKHLSLENTKFLFLTFWTIGRYHCSFIFRSIEFLIEKLQVRSE